MSDNNMEKTENIGTLNAATEAWPEYVCNVKLGCLQIDEVKEPVENALKIMMTEITFVDKRFKPISVVPFFITEHNPQPGGYLVRVDGGLVFMLQDEFERTMNAVDTQGEEDTHS